MTHQLAGRVVHNHELFPTAFPPSGTLTDVSLSYQSQEAVPKHFAMKMQRRGLLPPAKRGQLSEVMSAGDTQMALRAAPTARHTPEDRECPLHSCSHRGRALPPSHGSESLPGWGWLGGHRPLWSPECATLAKKARP